MGEGKKNIRVLVVTDSRDRINFLSYHIRSHDMKPVSYPNPWAAMHALEVDAFGMVVVDLTLPVEGKLELVKRACLWQKGAKMAVIGKTEYLEESGALDRFASVERIPSIQAFPEWLGEESLSEDRSRASSR